MKTLRKYKKKTLLGVVDNEKIYLTAPSWDCGWYWGFGYLGNKNCHYHLNGLNKDMNLHDAILEHFGETIHIQPSKLWEFSELITTFYNLKQACEVLGRGGSRLSENPCKDFIINSSEVERINNVVLPQVFDAIYRILESFEKFNKDMKVLEGMILDGDTIEIVEFMKKNEIKTDDLKNRRNIPNHDFSVIHSAYWKDYHQNK